MKAQIIIVGTGHSLQVGGDKYRQDQVEKFRGYLKELCRSHKIEHIAEEMNGDGLADYGKKESIPSQIAGELSLCHHYVDLTNTERANLGIDRGALAMTALNLSLMPPQIAALENAFGKVRECCWLARVLAINIWPTLFICGADHVASFKSLINCMGQDVIVACNDYEP